MTGWVAGGILAVCLIVYVFTSDWTEQRSAATDTANPTSTPRARPTPDLMATITARTGIVLPTATPSPTFVPSYTCPSEEEEEYLDAVKRYLTWLGSDIAALSRRWSQADEVPALETSPRWLAELKNDIAKVDATLDSMLSLEAPPHAMGIHENVQTGAEYIDRYLQAQLDYLDTQDAYLAIDAVDDLAVANSHIRMASNAIVSFCARLRP